MTLLVAVVHATVTDLAAVFRYFEDPARAPDSQIARTLLIGLKESTRPAALGGIFLTLVPLLAAVGVYREYGLGKPAYFFLGSSNGTPFFSWITRSLPSLHAPLMVLPSSLLP